MPSECELCGKLDLTLQPLEQWFVTRRGYLSDGARAHSSCGIVELRSIEQIEQFACLTLSHDLRLNTNMHGTLHIAAILVPVAELTLRRSCC
jgi:hypothetical protein